MTDSQDFKYDVFISYARADKDWVRQELLPRLDKAQINYAIDFKDLRIGSLVAKEIERCIMESRKMLTVLSPKYIEREWTEFEDAMLRVMTPANRDLILIPLRKEICELPPRFNTLTYVDFAEPDDPEWSWTQLITALGGNIAYETPKTPSRESWCLVHPYATPPNFTGRKAERKLLKEWLEQDKINRLLVLRALGGFGKSALCWHWLMLDVDPPLWPRVVCWSFYDDTSF